jgi:hypothetical protein
MQFMDSRGIFWYDLIEAKKVMSKELGWLKYLVKLP